jgi:hypothetical protein
MTEHRVFCDCVECLKKKIASLNTETAALHKLLEKRRLETWATMQPKELLYLWLICRAPFHLETPDDVAVRFGKAVCFRLLELNWEAFCAEGRSITTLVAAAPEASYGFPHGAVSASKVGGNDLTAGETAPIDPNKWAFDHGLEST